MFAKFDVTNHVSGTLLSSQPESGLAFNFTSLMSISEFAPFWTSTRKACIFRVARTRETLMFYM